MLSLMSSLGKLCAPALMLSCVLFLSFGFADAQGERHERTLTGFDDVVFAISFSPDGRTLAIARGANEPAQRFGRVELWDVTSGQLRRVIRGFDGPVGSVSFSPDGQTLVSGSREYHSEKIQEKARSREGTIFGELKWWDVQTGELRHQVTLPGEGSASLRAIYSPDGNALVVTELFSEFAATPGNSPDNFPGRERGRRFPPLRAQREFFTADLKFLDARTGEQQIKLKVGRSRQVAFSPDGVLLAVEDDNQIKLWNAQTKREEQTLKGFKGRLSAFAFSPDGGVLAVTITKYHNEETKDEIRTIGNSEIGLFDVHTWKVTNQLTNIGLVKSLAFADGGRLLLLGGLINQKDQSLPGVKFCDLQTGGAAVLLTGGEDYSESVDSLVVAHRDGLLAVQTGPLTVKLLDTKTGKVKQTFDEHSVADDRERGTSRFLMSVKRVMAVEFSADGNMVSGELEQGEVKLWDRRTGEVKRELDGDDEPASAVAIAADGNAMAAINKGTLRVWSLSGDAKRTLSLTGGSISAIALSGDGQTLAAVTGKEISLLNVSTGAVLKRLPRQTQTTLLEFSKDGRRLASADEAGQIAIWDLASERIETTVNAGSKVTALSFGPDGQTLASAADDHTVSVWDLRSGSQQMKLQKHSAAVNALAFSPDGRLLASGSDDRTVVIWDTLTGKSKRTLKGHDQTVTSLAFSPDGNLLASGCGNASVVIWDLLKGNFVRVLR
jgi:WD40 repeat protein